MTGPTIKNINRQNDAAVSTGQAELHDLSDASMGQSLESEIAIAEGTKIGAALVLDRAVSSGHTRVVSFSSSPVPLDDGTGVEPQTDVSSDRSLAVGQPVETNKSAAAPDRTVTIFSTAP